MAGLTRCRNRLCSPSFQEFLNRFQKLFRITGGHNGINTDRKLGMTLAFFQQDDRKSRANIFQRRRHRNFLPANRFGIQNRQCNSLCDADCNSVLPSSCNQNSQL